MSIPLNLFLVAALFPFAIASPVGSDGAVVAVSLLATVLTETATAFDLPMLISDNDCESTEPRN